MPKPTELEIKECAAEAARKDGYTNPVILHVQPYKKSGHVEVVTWIVSMIVTKDNKSFSGSTTVNYLANSWYAEPKIDILPQ